jgi:hypothetical protein
LTTPVTHTLGPFIGADALGWHSTCSCSHRVEGASKDELRIAHQKHAGAGAVKPGIAKARQALESSIERGKPEPAEVAS